MKKKVIWIVSVCLVLAAIVIADHAIKTKFQDPPNYTEDPFADNDENTENESNDPGEKTVPPNGSEPDVLPNTSFFYDTVLYTFQENNELELSVMCVDVGQTEAIIPEYVPYKGYSYYVTRIGENAFQEYCSDVEEITFPSTITDVGYQAFEGTAWLERLKSGGAEFVSVGDSVLVCYLGVSEEVIIPEGTKHIGGAFFQNTSIKKVILPDTVTSIGERAFYACSALSEVELPGSVSEIGIAAFFGTPWLAGLDEDFTVAGDGILLQYNGKSAIVEVPDGVKVIAPNAFQGNSAEKIILPSSVTTLAPEAFAGLTELVELELPDGITYIGENAFAMCQSLKRMKLPASLEMVGVGIFIGCTELDEVTMRSHLKDLYPAEYMGVGKQTDVKIIYE